MFYYSIPTEFILLGITNAPEVKVVLFVLFLIIYLVILVTNLEMIISVRIDSQLHLPMYFFLHHMSFSDLCYSTDIGPKMLVDFFAKDKPIFFIGCALKFHVFCYFTDCESLLLAVMAFDRYMAINNSVLYTVNMSSRVCYLLMAGVHMVTMVDILLHTILTFTVTFCRSNEINHFLCDVPPPQLIFSSDTHVNELVIFTVFGFIEMVSISVVLISFCYTILSVFKIHSSEGRGKTFSACTSHLTAVPVFQGTLLFMYFRPSSA